MDPGVIMEDQFDLAQYQLSDEERRKLLMSNALLGIGAGLLGARKGNEFGALGSGMMNGVQMGQNAVSEARKGKFDSAKMAEWSQGQRDKRAAAQANAELMARIAAIGNPGNPTQGMPSRAPSVENAAQAPAVPAKWELYERQAQAAMAGGALEQAKFYAGQAEKFRPKFSQTPQIGSDAQGGLYNYVLDEQGNPKRLDAGVKPDFAEVNTGGDVRFVNKHAMPSSGQSFAKTIGPDSQLSSDTTRRGQDMTDTRAREFNAITRAGQGSGNVSELRKEFNGLPQVKAYNEVQPVLQSARDALGTNTAAADMNLVYAAAKIMDPTSVVRESETAMVMATGSPAQKYLGQFNYIAGGGRLTPEVRKNLMNEIESRGRGYESSYKATRRAYEGIATKVNVPHDQVFIEPFAPSLKADAPKSANLTNAEAAELAALKKKLGRQ